MAIKEANTLLPVSQSRQGSLLKLEQEFQPEQETLPRPTPRRERADSGRPSSLYNPTVLPDSGPSLEEPFKLRKPTKPPLNRRNSKPPTFPAISENESDVPDYSGQKRPTTLSILESEVSPPPSAEKKSRVKFSGLSPKSKPAASLGDKQPYSKKSLPSNKRRHHQTVKK